MRVTLSALSGMQTSDRHRALTALVSEAATPLNERSPVNEEIRGFEQRYGMTSGDMRSQVESGRLQDTDDFASWLMLLYARESGA